MWPAFPTSDYYGGSAPSQGQQPTAGLPATGLAGQWEGRPPEGSRVHHAPVGGGGAQLFPCSLATSTPQSFLVASGPADATPTAESPTQPFGCACAASRPISARLEPGQSLEGVRPLVHVVLHLPALLAEPEPSGSADPSRRCRGCSHPPLRFQDQAAPSSYRPAATGRRWALTSHPVSWRLAAHGVDDAVGTRQHRVDQGQKLSAEPV